MYSARLGTEIQPPNDEHYFGEHFSVLLQRVALQGVWEI